MSAIRSFSSESVSEGHPDKIADQVSDAILDALIEQDKDARVACETLIKGGMVFVAGEISTSAYVDIEQIVRGVLNDIGYNVPGLGIDSDSCAVLLNITKQSTEIAHVVHGANMGAGDQGMVFGFACNETPELMPFPIMCAHRLMQQQAKVRKSGLLSWMRPDAKAQVTVRYDGFRPVGVDAVILSTQHAPDVPRKELVEAVIETVILPVIPEHLRDENIRYLVNPAGSFVSGGPAADCGVTGRKIIVDTYGGMASHGGGAFSGKDPSKVDRSGAYMARYLAKSIVKAGVADRCEIQIAYAIGVQSPISLYVNCYGTNKIPEEEIRLCIQEKFSLTPHAIIGRLRLVASPIYRKTACYGHFGREDMGFSWEDVDEAVKEFVKIGG